METNISCNLFISEICNEIQSFIILNIITKINLKTYLDYIIQCLVKKKYKKYILIK